VFTEQGVAMLSSVLHSPRAVAVNIEIMRAFVRLRDMLASHADLARRQGVVASWKLPKPASRTVARDAPFGKSPNHVASRHRKPGHQLALRGTRAAFPLRRAGHHQHDRPERRISQYFIPIAKPRKTANDRQQTFDEWTEDRIEENKTVNAIRRLIQLWREGRYTDDVTRTTARLLEYWQRNDRSRRLFFCQIEALETLIYITEVAKRYGHTWIENDLRRFNEDANPGLLRIAAKMATGSGKTVVIAMLIVWHVLNKLANPRDARFTDSFLIVTPGITIRDRLRVLLPNDPTNYYRALDLVPPDLMDQIAHAKIVITNFHAFRRREKIKAAALTKAILHQGEDSPFTESEGEMVRRVCRAFGTKRNILAINDEAHHCYRRRADGDQEKLTGDERREAEKRAEAAHVWISGLEAVQRKLGIKTVYDLSATPFFLRGSGYGEGTLFPWVVSDFSLIDAIESGIVKVPRVPVADDAMTGELPTYRDLWLRIRDDLPKKGRKTEAVSGEPKLPAALEGALQTLYANYAKCYQRWEDNQEARANGLTPPVFIVVCNNTNVSKMVFDYIAGWEKPLPTEPPSPSPANSKSSATSRADNSPTAPTPSWSIPSNWNPATR
jgi:type III restriction enzyme